MILKTERISDPCLRIRIVFGDAEMIGPGRIIVGTAGQDVQEDQA